MGISDPTDKESASITPLSLLVKTEKKSYIYVYIVAQMKQISTTLKQEKTLTHFLFLLYRSSNSSASSIVIANAGMTAATAMTGINVPSKSSPLPPSLIMLTSASSMGVGCACEVVEQLLR